MIGSEMEKLLRLNEHQQSWVRKRERLLLLRDYIR